MVEFVKEVVGMLEVNCYLIPVESSRTLYIIDPGSEADKIVEKAKTFDYDKVIILLTHAHIDHISAVGAVNDQLDVDKVYLHPDDHKLYHSPDNNLLPYIPSATNLPSPVDNLKSEDFEIIHTPGHSRGSVCFHFQQIPALFSGDTLFAGSIGRTDLPGGDMNSLTNSVHSRLYILPEELFIYPGHGASSSIGIEKQSNPFV